jgi:hypothetical protein
MAYLLSDFISPVEWEEVQSDRMPSDLEVQSKAIIANSKKSTLSMKSAP